MSDYGLAVAYTHHAFDEIIDQLKSMPAYEHSCLIDHFDSADINIINFEGKLFLWNKVDDDNNYHLDIHLCSVNSKISSPSSFRYLQHFNDGSLRYEGRWMSEPFNMRVASHIAIDKVGSSYGGLIGVGPHKQASQPQKAISLPPVNDHICTSCGNKACSKTEKSCWRCGSSIIP